MKNGLWVLHEVCTCKKLLLWSVCSKLCLFYCFHDYWETTWYPDSSTNHDTQQPSASTVMKDTEWIEQVEDNEGSEWEWTWIRRNVKNATEYVQQQVDTPDDCKETSHLHHTHTQSTRHRPSTTEPETLQYHQRSHSLIRHPTVSPETSQSHQRPHSLITYYIVLSDIPQSHQRAHSLIRDPTVLSHTR